MFYDDEEEISITDVKNIKKLYELRHYSNVLGDDIVIKELNISKKDFEKLKYSDYHGSKDITPILRGSREQKELYYKELDEDNLKHEDRVLKKYELIYILEQSRANFAGVGTRKAKIRLNKLAKTDNIALVVRKLLEIEDVNIQAKKESIPKYVDYKYNLKSQLILELIEIFKLNGFIFGYHYSDIKSISHIIYFELPNTEIQLSWHCDLKNISEIPKYTKEWDGLENSNMLKLEKYIENLFKKVDI
jgi:hypothetical protein